jgi:NADH pyrophosphatase NudC (nudix superfamily)
MKKTNKAEWWNSTSILTHFTNCRTICKCGHSVYFTNVHDTKKICSYCGNYCYKNDKAEFKEKMKKLLKN